MKIIDISVDKSTVFDDVSLNSEYTGAKNDTLPDFYKRVATVDADTLLLEGFWTELCGVAAEKLQPYITRNQSDNQSLRLTLELSGACDDSLSPLIEADIRGGIAAGITARWLAFTAPDKATEWQKQTQLLLDRATARICHRRRPVRKQ